jgi:hypothetical protein
MNRRRPRPSGMSVTLALAAFTALIAPQAASAAAPSAAAAAVTAGALTQALPTGSCPDAVDEAEFASKERLEDLVDRIASFGLRMPATAEHNQMLDWLDGELAKTPELEIRSQDYTMTRWQPTGRAADGTRSLETSAKLAVVGAGEPQPIPVAGSMAYTTPTGASGAVGEVTYLAPGVPITPENAAGKIVVRDVPSASIPYAAIIGFSHYVAPDLLPRAAGSYDRPFLVTSNTADLQAAQQSGAVGYIWAFNVPTSQVAGYFGSHTGTLERIPGVWIGVEERERLKQLAGQKATLRMDVLAEVAPEQPTRNIIATLPGQSSEKIVLISNSDGNSYVQENGGASLVALAEYFATLPLECRPKTLEFVFTSAHLGFTWDGTFPYGDELLAKPEDIHFIFVTEHLGTREILPVDRTDGGPGQVLQFTGQPEPYAWFAPTESPALVAGMTEAVAGRGERGTAVLRGLDVPSPGRFPTSCNFGGLANNFHARFAPTIGGISGPWSMWAPSFGKDAIDFDRLHLQTLVAGDTILNLDDVPGEVIDGAYPAEQAAVESGAATACPLDPPAKIAPASTTAPDSGSSADGAATGSGHGSDSGPGGSAGGSSQAVSGARLPATGATPAAGLLALVILAAAAGLSRRRGLGSGT